MVVTDVLAPIWCQAICNHHDDVRQSVHISRAIMESYQFWSMPDLHTCKTKLFTIMCHNWIPINQSCHYKSYSNLLIAWSEASLIPFQSCTSPLRQVYSDVKSVAIKPSSHSMLAFHWQDIQEHYSIYIYIYIYIDTQNMVTFFTTLFISFFFYSQNDTHFSQWKQS